MQPKSKKETITTGNETNPLALEDKMKSTSEKRKHGGRAESPADARKAQRTGDKAQDDKMAPSEAESPNATSPLIQFRNKEPLNQGPYTKESGLDGNSPKVPGQKLKLVSSKNPDNLLIANQKVESRTQKTNKDVQKTGLKIRLWWTDLGETDKKEDVNAVPKSVTSHKHDREVNAGDAILHAAKADIMDLPSESETGKVTKCSEESVPFDPNPLSPTHQARAAGTVVNEFGSPMRSRKSPGTVGSGVDANDLMMKLDSKEFESKGGLKMQSGSLSGNSMLELDQKERGGSSSLKRSGSLVPFSSSTRKAVPSSPTAPSRMLQDLVAHKEITGGGFASMQNDEIVKPGVLEDPFAVAPAPATGETTASSAEDRLFEVLHAIAQVSPSPTVSE